MKKHIIAAFLALASIAAAQAQRMMPGQKALEVNAGGLIGTQIADAFYLNIGMTVSGKKGNYQVWAVEYARRYHDYKETQIPQETYTVEGGYSFFLLGDTRKIITLNAAITGVVGYESINRGQAMLYDGAQLLSTDHFVYGTGGRLTFETYLSDRFILVLKARTKALWGTDLKRLRPSAGVGLRFNF